MRMREEEQTSIHLLLAGIVSAFSVMLILITIVMSWEQWMVPVIAVGSFGVWCLHIGRFSRGMFYEYLCAGLMLIEFFFFGVHTESLFDIPAVACIMIFIFSLLDRNRLLYMTAGLYSMVLLYHFLVLHTIHYNMGERSRKLFKAHISALFLFLSFILSSKLRKNNFNKFPISY